MVKVNEVIKKLNVGDEVWLKGKINDKVLPTEETGCSTIYPIHVSGFGYIGKDTEISLTEPQAEKVEVPDFVAEWYESNKHKLERAIIDVACSMEKGEFPYNLPFEDWFIDPENHPIETLIKMKLNGYTLKPKRWVVKNDRGYVAMENFKDFKNQRVGVKLTITGEKSESLAWDDVDLEKAEAVATLVDGSVEEV